MPTIAPRIAPGGQDWIAPNRPASLVGDNMMTGRTMVQDSFFSAFRGDHSPRRRIERSEAQVINQQSIIDALCRQIGLDQQMVIANVERTRQQEIIDVLRRGTYIEAIKLYRELYHVGLREAHAQVNRLRGRLG